MDETKCLDCGSKKIVGHNVVFFSGSPDEYYQDYHCFKCFKSWRNFYKTILNSQKSLNGMGEYEEIENAGK